MPGSGFFAATKRPCSGDMPNQRVCLFLLAVLYFSIGTWSLPLIDRDEPRFAEASREMRANGDYLIPFFNRAYRFDKPPLIYWAQTAAFHLFGESDFAARFPSVLAAALTAVVVSVFGSRLYGPEVGWKAALIFLTTLQVVLHAKGAVADMAMVLFFTLAMWTGWEQGRPDLSSRARWSWSMFFHVTLALGFLAKGPVAWLPLGALGMDTVLRPREEPYPAGGLKRLLAGLVITVGIIALWGIPALERTQGAFLKEGIGKHVIGRSISTMEGHGPKAFWGYIVALPFYLLMVFPSFFPWSLRLPSAYARLRRQPKRIAQYRFLIIGIGLVFGVFTLVRTKLPHYTLPAFPLMAIIMAREWDFLPTPKAKIETWAIKMMAATTVLLLLAPWVAHIFPSYNLIEKSASALTRDMEFASSGYQEPSLVWYARRHVDGWHNTLSPKKLAQFMEKQGPRFCVAPKGTISPKPEWVVFETEGFNLVHFRKVTLQLLIKPR